MKEKTLINFINHYTSCPVCDGNIVINTDLSIPSTVEKQEDGLLIIVYEDDREPLELRLNYSKTIESNRPFIISAPYNKLRRTLRCIPTAALDRVQLEVGCIECGNFRYWSNNIVMDPATKTMGPVEIRFERAELKHNGEHIILYNNLKDNKLVIYNSGRCSLPFVGSLKGLPLRDTERLILEIKNQFLIQ